MRRRRFAGISLFAFQDVLTAVIGIMVVVLLIISFEVSGVVGIFGGEHLVLEENFELFKIKKKSLEQTINQLDNEIVKNKKFIKQKENAETSNDRLIYREKLRTEYDSIRRYQNEIQVEESELQSSILEFIQSEDNHSYLKKYQDKVRMESELIKIRDSDYLTYYVSSRELPREQTLFLCVREFSAHFISAAGGGFSTDISEAISKGEIGLELAKTIEEFLKNQEIKYILLLVHPSGFKSGAAFGDFFNQKNLSLKIEYGIQVLSPETSCEDIKIFAGE